MSKTPAMKPRGSKSGTPASVPNNYVVSSNLEQFSDDEADGDETATYCVCNGPESINMIACDSCEGWFHRRVACLGEGDVALFKELAEHIDHWYCPPCRKKDPSLAVTWFRGCRRQRCNKKARVDQDPPSKYCSEECAVKFFEERIAQAPKGPEPSRGGALTQSEIALILNATTSAAEFKKLGKAPPKLRAKGKIVSKKFLRNIANGGGENTGKVFENKSEYKTYKDQEADNENERRGLELHRQQMHERYNQLPDRPLLNEEDLAVGIEVAMGNPGGITKYNYLEVDWSFLQKNGVINPSEAQTIDELQELMKFDADWISVNNLRLIYLKAVHEHIKEILESKNLDLKNTCGYLPQISMSDNEFRKYVETPEGAKICDTGRYEPLDASEAGEWRERSEKAMCMHSSKKHATHHRWYDVHDKEVRERIGQLRRSFDGKLREFQEIMDMLEKRLYMPEWEREWAEMQGNEVEY